MKLRERLARWIFPEAFETIRIQAEALPPGFDKRGWKMWNYDPPRFEDFPILEMRDEWKSPSELDWQSHYNPLISQRNVAGLYWRPLNPQSVPDQSEALKMRSEHITWVEAQRLADERRWPR